MQSSGDDAVQLRRVDFRAVELKRKKPGSQNSISGLAAAGGEGWLYFWDVTDTRFP
jgi:hypothetical protein